MFKSKSPLVCILSFSEKLMIRVKYEGNISHKIALYMVVTFLCYIILNNTIRICNILSCITKYSWKFSISSKEEKLHNLYD